MRTVVLHYHLFKNAGTSVDILLQQNFPGGWISQEFPGQGGNNSALVRDWIADNPDMIAFSSHTMLGPLPEVKGTHIIPFMLLRDPVERIISAYHFERKQQADTKGARLAKEHDLPGYIDARFAMPGDRQCRNFQTARLAGMVPGNTAEAPRAMQAIKTLCETGVVGLVSEFDAAMADLAHRLRHDFPHFNPNPTRANAAPRPAPRVSASVLARLRRANRDDLALVHHLRAQLAAA